MLNTTKTFPTLYQRSNATGAIQQWTIEAGEEGATTPEERPRGYFRVTYGQMGGKMQESIDWIAKGKNEGKKNATTPTQQAEKEAESRWNKKRDREGYVEDLERAKAGERDQQGVAVMLAEVVDDIHPDNLIYPAHLQTKIDGNRMPTQFRPGQPPAMWSRKQKSITHLVPHIVKAWELAFPDLDMDLDLDGEAYKHGWKLQKISSFFGNNKAPKPGHEELAHFIYDMPSHKGTWAERQKALDAVFSTTIFPNIQAATGRSVEVVARFPDGSPAIEGIFPIFHVRSYWVTSLQAAWEVADHMAMQGYEGGIMRQLRAVYEFDRRSGVLAKLKRYKDAEFPIKAVREGRGKFAGLAVCTCITPNGVEFDCVAPGDFEEKAQVLRDADKIAGKLSMTIRYFGYTDDGSLAQPTPIVIRNYE